MHCGGFWKQNMDAKDRHTLWGRPRGCILFGKQDMEKECTQFLCISEYLHIKPTYFRNEKGHNLTKMTYYIVDLMK